MANLFVQPSVVASEALMHLEDALVIGNMAYRDKTDEFDKVGGYAVGDTVTITTRPEYEAKEFTTAIEIQDTREAKATFAIEKHYDISIEITAKERALDLDSFSEQVIMPAAYELARQVDEYLGTKILDGRGLYVSNTLFTTAADMALARKDATEQQLAQLGRFGLVDLTLEAQLLGQDFFNQVQIRGQDAQASLMGGRMGSMMGANWFSSINFPTPAAFAAGTLAAATPLTNGAPLVGATSIAYDGGAVGTTFEAGDRIKIAGARRPLIVATQTVGATGTIPLAHEIDEIIADNAAITIIGEGQSYTIEGAQFDMSSMAFAMPPLDQPPGADAAVISNNGISIRVVSDYDISAKKETMSLDLLVGGVAYDARRIQLLADY